MSVFQLDLERSARIATNTFELVKKLKEMEQWRGDLFAAAPYQIHIKDSELKYTMVSASFAETLGISEEEIIGRTAEEVYEYVDPRNTEVEHDVLRSGKLIEFDVQAIVRGERRDFHVVKFPMLNSNEQVDRVGSIGIDTTDQRKAERRARETEELLREALDSIPHGFAIYSSDGKVILCNSSFARTYGVEPDELRGVTVDDILERARGILSQIRSPTESWPLAKLKELHDLLLNGEIEYLELQHRADAKWFLITINKGAKGNIALTRVDITDQKNREQHGNK